MTQPLLSVRNLTCERNECALFRGVSFEVKSGQVLQIRGANGTGKTTLLRALTGLMPSTEGEFSWRGQPVSHPDEFSDELFYLGHKPAIKPRLTPREMLNWYSAIRSVAVDREQSSRVLTETGLEGMEETLCNQLSAGQQRRVALAALRSDISDLWVLDEPFTSIDQQGVSSIVIDRKSDFDDHPRARFMDSCTLELFRQLGLCLHCLAERLACALDYQPL